VAAFREDLKPRQPRGDAEELALDMPRSAFALKHRFHRQRINERVEGGRPSGAGSSPSIFVDGAPVDVSAGVKRLLEATELRLHVCAQLTWIAATAGQLRTGRPWAGRHRRACRCAPREMRGTDPMSTSITSSLA
jgi:hypothetical protein